MNHTGGGDGEQLENGIAASLKLGGEIKKYSEAVVKAFEANGFYELFDAWQVYYYVSCYPCLLIHQ